LPTYGAAASFAPLDMRRFAVLLVLAAACGHHDRLGDREAPSIAIPAAASGSASAASSPVIAPPSAWPVQNAMIDAPRVYSKSRHVNVYADASTSSKPIGYLWVAGSVRLKSTEPVKGPGCAKLYAVEPRGYVCVDGQTATLDANDAIYQELLKHAPDVASPWPYRYGESQGALKNKFLKHYPQPKWPKGLQDPRDELAHRSTVAWTGEFETKKRTFLWTSDLAFVAKDRVKPYPRVAFEGIRLGGDAKLPIAFFRRFDHKRLRREAEGRFVETGESWPRLTHVALTGKSESAGDKTYWETKDGDAWLDAAEVGIAQQAKEVPAGVSGARRTWVDVSARHGWLVAYENDAPVFATMISAGKLGAAVPRAADPKVPPATTPIGQWPIRAKYVTWTMAADLDSGEEFVHSEVPWSQHFFDKYLLHTAYWHDAWGEGRSGGCVNLSPMDAKWLFDWSEPRVPEGWHAYIKGDTDEPATIVVVHS
jgi:lipoprotein-anchoring transpeptidase ErfK/SrfK